MRSIPEDFARFTAETRGAEAPTWLERLPATLDECARRWSLTLGAPFAALSYNYVVAATRADGTPAVLKICFPDHELLLEIAALRHYDGRGAVRLLDADTDRYALLLEQLEPGTLLSEVCDDAAATAAAIAVMRQLWRPLPSAEARRPFPTVAQWGAAFGRVRARFGGSGPLPASLFAEAEQLHAELDASSSAEPVLLHGDLHHGNILAARRAPWLAIDPKGVIGEPAYDTGSLLRNPMPAILSQPEPGRILARRMGQLSEELGFDRARMHGWAVSQAVLSACWHLEDGSARWREAIACAEVLAALPA